MQDIDDCKSKISEYLKGSDLEIKIEELDDCILDLISCWCQSGVEPMAIALTLKPISLRMRIIKYLKFKSIDSITEDLISEIEKRVNCNTDIPTAYNQEIELRNSRQARKNNKP